jgi:hypothetical protein
MFKLRRLSPRELRKKLDTCVSNVNSFVTFRDEVAYVAGALLATRFAVRCSTSR